MSDMIAMYTKLLAAKDTDGILALCSEDVHFKNPKWEAKGKAACKKKMLSNETPEFYGQTTPEASADGKVYTRKIKAKVAFGLITIKAIETFTIEDGKFTSVIAKSL
eukprot:TRINITY_DN38886_c0_g1_i4.p1 TRINITY_DN38886_c0_g1~~TRINITY_DN38886_c0_g1_i4.p1  ORF type:complete len:122 (+),score=48.39 TRINITY_DN38886_c0_g1_i4:46-366(+)